MYIGMRRELPPLIQALLNMGDAYAENLLVIAFLGTFVVALITF